MEKEVQKHRPCPNCGNEMEYSADHGSLYCRHCETGQEVLRDPDFVPSGTDYLDTLGRFEEHSEATDRISVVCDNCAAEGELPENVVADRCPYCDSPIFAAAKSSRMLRPTAVLPFKVGRDEAQQCFRKWLGSRWFLPNAVKEESRISQFKGIYLPHWTYDNSTTTHYTGRRGEYYYVTVSYTATENGKQVTKTRQERRTRWYPAAGIVYNKFQNLLIPANHTLPQDMVDRLEPWGLAALEEYQADFIRGHQEQSYSLPLAQGFERAKNLMAPEIDRNIRYDIGGDVQDIFTSHIIYRNISFKLILLPVWENLFRFRNEDYIFLVNARTGEVQGKRPWSHVKIISFILILTALLAGIVLLINYYG